MKVIRSFVSLLLSSVLLLSMVGCAKAPADTDGAEQNSEPQQEQSLILQQRRDAVEKYMRQMLTVLWRSEEDIIYDISNTVTSPNGRYKIISGRLYRGIPYAFACGTTESFLGYAGEPEENGIYTVSGLSWKALNGTGKYARIGSDCSSAITTAWSQVSPSITATQSCMMFEDHGVLPVGDYIFEPEMDTATNVITNTFPVLTVNGIPAMYEAYAQLKKADAVVHVDASNHSMMIVETNVVYTESGDVDGDKSTVTVLQQTRNNFLKERVESDSRVNEQVYVIGGVDDVYTFYDLASQGYIPVTIRELVDPATVEEPSVTDSVTSADKETLFTGTIHSNMYIDSVTITVFDSQAAAVQQATAGVTRNKNNDFEMAKFMEDAPESIRGKLDLQALSAGTYRCTVVCRLTTGQEFTVRDFEFSV